MAQSPEELKVGDIVVVLPIVKEGYDNFHPEEADQSFYASKEMMEYIDESFVVKRVKDYPFGQYIYLDYINNSQREKYSPRRKKRGPVAWTWTNHLLAKEVTNASLASALLFEDDTLC